MPEWVFDCSSSVSDAMKSRATKFQNCGIGIGKFLETVELDSPNCGIGFTKLWNRDWQFLKTVEFDSQNCGIRFAKLWNWKLWNWKLWNWKLWNWKWSHKSYKNLFSTNWSTCWKQVNVYPTYPKLISMSNLVNCRMPKLSEKIIILVFIFSVS